MIDYRTRSTWTSSPKEYVTYKPSLGWVEFFDPPRPQEAKVMPCQCWPVRTCFEAYTPNSGRPMNRMKHFEHFVRRVGNASYSGSYAPYRLDGAAPHLTKQWGYGDSFGYPSWNGYPYYTGIHRDPYFGWLPGKFEIGDPSDPTLGLDQWFAPGTSSATAFTPLTDKWDDLCALGLRAAVPRIKSEMSLINSVIELRDIRSMAKTVRRLGEWVNDTVYHLRAYLLRTSRVAADVYLQGEFNIKPLLADVLALKRSVQLASNKFDRLLGRNARPSTFHWTTTFNETDSYSKTSVYKDLSSFTQLIYPKVDGGLGIDRECVTEPTVFCFTVQYTPYWSDVQKKLSTLLAVLDSLGVQLNPGIVWNAIPWSFVVDWVLKVGNLLDSFALSWTEPLVIVHQCCASLRRRRRINCTLRYGYSLPANIGGYTTVVPIVTEESYIRLPVSMHQSSLEASGLSPKEATLGLALALSRKNRVRTHVRV